MTARFIHFRVRSTYSLLEGAMRVKQLAELAVKNQMPALALTDHNNLYASLDFCLTTAGIGVQPILGCIFSFHALDAADTRHASRAQCDELLLIALNEVGYNNLIWLCSHAHLSSADPAHPLLHYADLESRTDGLVALTGGQFGVVGKRLLMGRKDKAKEFLEQLASWFPTRVYVELMRHGIDAEKHIEADMLALAQELNLPIIATNDVYFSDPSMVEAHDALMCIADGLTVAQPDRQRLTAHHYFKSQDEMCTLFADLPEAFENTLHLARRVHVMAQVRPPILPRFAEDEAEALQQEARAGLDMRLQKHVFTPAMSREECERIAAPYRDRLEFELGVIISMKFPGYFLIVSDFIRWSKEQGIPVGPGRGSGAGSVVAWALQITDLDPLKYGLLFERFLNPERVSMPDFDIDFCQDRRDEVIAYVQNKYGTERVAHIITFGKLQARAVLRDVGRVLQLPYGQVDSICKFVPNNPAAPVTLPEAIKMEPALQAAIAADDQVERMVDYAKKLEGLNRHASTHAAGIVIGDRPLQELVPMTRDPKSDIRVVQYSMKYAELAGLVKFDFLGLKTLTVLKKATEFIALRGITIDLLQLPEGDKATYKMLGRGDTMGVFQLESTGMRDTLKRLKPDCLEDIIALVSLYRPGPMENIPTYTARKHGQEKPEYLHPKLEEVLKETFGVIIYQEQVMQIAQVLAGYSLGEADLLRRAMGKKIRSEMEAQRAIFVERSVSRGVAEPQAKAIFDLIAKFAEYGFNKSHAAAYALIAYQTAYIKANYPVEFFAASMTYDMQNTDKLAVLREEASRFGITLLPPDMNRSGVVFSPEGDKAIRYGLSAVRNVGAQAMTSLVAERERGGAFVDVWEMARRLESHVMNKRQLEYLVKAGAFDSLHKNRREIFDSLERLIGYNGTIAREKDSQQVSLFGDSAAATIQQPALNMSADWSATERMTFENEALGFYLSSHPLQAYRGALKRLGVIPSGRLADMLGSQYSKVRVAGLVSKLKIRTSDKGKFAFVSMSDEQGAFEVSIFKEDILNRYRTLLEAGNVSIVAMVDGKREESGTRLILQSLEVLDEAIASVQAKAMPKSVRILFDSDRTAEQLKTVLGSSSDKGTRVMLSALVEPDVKVEIALSGYYTLTPQTLMQLPMIEGVREYSEA